MTHKSAAERLNGNLVFGNKWQIKAVKFEEAVARLLVNYESCPNSHIVSVDCRCKCEDGFTWDVINQARKDLDRKNS